MRTIFLFMVAVGVLSAMAGHRPGTSDASSPPASSEPYDPWSKPSNAVATRSSSAAASMPSNPGDTTLMREGDGHFYAQAEVNYGSVRFMIDTGASTVALTQDDARRANINFDPGSFQVVGSGASGPVYGQVVSIGSITLDGKRASGLTGIVMRDADRSLLGQTFLATLESVKIEGDRMVLR